MPDPLLHEAHPTSGYAAVIADEGEAVWLYLTTEGPAIVADCWLLNRGPALTREDLRARADAYRARGAPPPAPAEALHARAVPGYPILPAFALRWNAAGTAVAATVDAAVLALVQATERRGYHRDLAAAGPWGAPLTADVLRAAFGEGDTGALDA